MDKPALVISTLIGYGDCLYLTPVIRFLKRCGFVVDMFAVNDEPFRLNPDLKSLKVLREKNVKLDRKRYGKNIFIFEDIGTSSCSNHTLDTLTRKVANITLRPNEKSIVLQSSCEEKEKVKNLLHKHGLEPHGNFVVISPAITWPSRTLPVGYYNRLILEIQALGDKVVIVGKDINPVKDFGAVAVSGKVAADELKGIYPARFFEGVIDLTNQLTFSELGCLYGYSPVAINTEGMNLVLTGVADDCWNIYITSLSPPEIRLPWRNGLQSYKTVVVENEDGWYPTHNYDVFRHLDIGELDLRGMKVRLPTVEAVVAAYVKVRGLFFD